MTLTLLKIEELFPGSRQQDTIFVMKNKKGTADPNVELWQRVVEFQGDLPPSAARALLTLGFSVRDRARMGELSTKARAGNLTGQEQAVLDTFERLGCLLDIVHSKARQALKKKPKKAT